MFALRPQQFSMVVLLLGVLGSTSSAITIRLDGRHDNYFSSNPTARAAIQAAAADVSAALTGSLLPITTDRHSGSSGGTNATLNWSFNYSNPATGNFATLSNATAPRDTITIFYGARNLSGSDLGFGGEMGAAATISVNNLNTASNFVNAVSNAGLRSEIAYTRGGEGPAVGALFDTVTTSGVTASWEAFFGPAYGSIAFDVDTNNDGQRDSASMLNNFWHFNHRTPVASGERDLYSVAVHEILHAIGFGSSATWDFMQSGRNWTGREVRDLIGSGNNLIDPDTSHFRPNLMSTRISDGTRQEVAMDPTLSPGTRKSLTALDLAVLRDLGYQTVALSPEIEGDFNSDGTVDAADYTVWRNGLGTTYTEADYRLWRSNLGATSSTGSSAAVAVPEPGTIGLLLLGIACSLPRRR